MLRSLISHITVVWTADTPDTAVQSLLQEEQVVNMPLGFNNPAGKVKVPVAMCASS